jgi:hypothetical protein
VIQCLKILAVALLGFFATAHAFAMKSDGWAYAFPYDSSSGSAFTAISNWSTNNVFYLGSDPTNGLLDLNLTGGSKPSWWTSIEGSTLKKDEAVE